MSTRILILKDGIITPSRSATDTNSIVTSLGLTKSSVGLGLVDNTSDVNKPISTATQTALNLKANLASPALTGIPTTPTATAGTNNTQIANTAFVSTAISNLVASSPAALDTLNELAAALGNDANFATTITNALALKAPLISPSFTTPNLGTPSAVILTNATELPLSTGVTGVLSIANGGTGSSSKNFVDLTTVQTIQGAKTFSGSPIIITAATTGVGGTGSVLKVVQTGAWSGNSPYVLEVIGYSYLDGFRITGQGGARGIYQIGSGLQLDFATNAGDITFTSGTIGTVERIRIRNTDGRVAVTSTTASTSTTTGSLIAGGGFGCTGNIYAGGSVINFAALPTSSTGLTAGSLWRNGNVVNIV